MKNFIQPGDVLDYTATADVASGAVVVMGARIGIAVADIATGETGAVRVKGVVELPKVTTAIAQGTPIYWDSVNNRLTATATDNTLAGYAAAAAGSGTTTIALHLNA
jgi:predicted RecA/RadA family phage recombinase